MRGEDERFYYIKDHLGSVRITIDEDGEIVSAQDYFPYGEIIPERSHITGGNVNDKYKFTEKERDIETGYDYFGARYYDSEIGRWLSVDPTADRYLYINPYNYTFNNPLNAIDPNGKFAIKTNDYGTFFMVIQSAWTVNWAVYGLGSTYDDNIFPENLDNVSDNLVFDVALNVFDKAFGTFLGAFKTGYEIINTITEGRNVFLRWEADKILYEQIKSDNRNGVDVFIRKELKENQIQYNRTGYQFLNGFIWLLFNPLIEYEIPISELEKQYETRRDVIYSKLKKKDNEIIRQRTKRKYYQYGGTYYGFNDTYHPGNR